MTPSVNSVMREQFAWTYGYLAMVHAAVSAGKTKYERFHFAIRSQFRNRYLSGRMKMLALHDDEKTKIVHATTCCYCGKTTKLTLDHMIPRLKGGKDAADNITYACKTCNSSKGPKDMVQWLVSKGIFPSVLVFRRYLKLAARWVEDNDLMDTPWSGVQDEWLPFDKRSLRPDWPKLQQLRLWPDPTDGGPV